MASYHYGKYYCKTCNTYMQTKKCPNCKTSNSGIPHVFVRDRVMRDGKLTQIKLTGFPTKRNAEEAVQSIYYRF